MGARRKKRTARQPPASYCLFQAVLTTEEIRRLSRYSDGLPDGRPVLESCHGEDTRILSNPQRDRSSGVLTPGIRWQGRETGHSPPFSTEDVALFAVRD
jgi:hypothetical protein